MDRLEIRQSHMIHLPGHVHAGFLSMITLYTFPVDPNTAKCLAREGRGKEVEEEDLSS